MGKQLREVKKSCVLFLLLFMSGTIVSTLYEWTLVILLISGGTGDILR